MQVITKPMVRLFSRQVFIENPDFLIPDDGNDAVKIGAFCAKTCYDSGGKNGRPNEENQESVKEHRHGSVTEHVVFGLYITGITRACSLESNRHRQLAVSQRSTRYTQEEDSAIVLEPYYAKLWDKYPMRENNTNYERNRWLFVDETVYPTTNPDAILLSDFVNASAGAVATYKEQVEMLMTANPNDLRGFDLRKWARGKARNILPHALETRIAYTGNVRAWRWFLEARSDKHAEPEIRRLAYEVYKVLLAESKVYFGDFYVSEIYDGIPVLTTPYSKI